VSSVYIIIYTQLGLPISITSELYQTNSDTLEMKAASLPETWELIPKRATSHKIIVTLFVPATYRGVIIKCVSITLFTLADSTLPPSPRQVSPL
jgi:hypothetical protein